MELAENIYESYGTHLRDLKVVGHPILINNFEDFYRKYALIARTCVLRRFFYNCSQYYTRWHGRFLVG